MYKAEVTNLNTPTKHHQPHSTPSTWRMKTFAGLTIVVAITLAAQLPHAYAASYRNALSKLLATMAELSTSHENRATNAELQQTVERPSNGISTIGCSRDMLQLNPNLEDLQSYWRDFGMEVDCSAHSIYCTDVKIHLDRKTFHSIICQGSSQGINCTHHIIRW